MSKKIVLALQLIVVALHCLMHLVQLQHVSLCHQIDNNNNNNKNTINKSNQQYQWRIGITAAAASSSFICLAS